MRGRIDRELESDEARELLALAEDFAAAELAPRAAGGEESGTFPRELMRELGRTGLLGLPFAEQYGGGAQPYAVYLQVVEELARSWLTVGLGVSVHTLACFPLAGFGDDDQRARWLPDMIGGEQLGAYCLSEPDAGSDAAALRTRAVRGEDGGFVVDGAKAWITHGGVADFYTVMVRTGGPGAAGISCVRVPAGISGLTTGAPEHKMGLTGSPTTSVQFADVHLPGDALLGAEGRGFAIAMAALEAGRLGLAACAVGLAQAALDVAVPYARERHQFGRPLLDHQGVGFLLADAATAVAAGRALYLAAARRRDAGLPCGREAAMAKLFCTDVAMRVTTDAVQVLGGYGYVRDFPVERYLREAKMLQIVEGTNQIQRLVISRSLATD